MNGENEVRSNLGERVVNTYPDTMVTATTEGPKVNINVPQHQTVTSGPVDINLMPGANVDKEYAHPDTDPNTKVTMTFLYKKCHDCGYLVDGKEELYKCRKDPECTAGRYAIQYGRNPEVLAKLLAEALYANNMKIVGKINKKLMKRKDGVSIMQAAHEKLRIIQDRAVEAKAMTPGV